MTAWDDRLTDEAYPRTRVGLMLGLWLSGVFAASLAVAQSIPDPRRSGYRDMGPALQKMQDDDTANPGMLFVQKGAGLWRIPAGASGKACADCHKKESPAIYGQWGSSKHFRGNVGCYECHMALTNDVDAFERGGGPQKKRVGGQVQPLEVVPGQSTDLAP